MRKIKFRGKRLDIGEWVYGSVVQFNEDFNENTRKKQLGTMIYVFKEDKYYKVAPESVKQFTGLKDKNEKEIYEGDIVEFEHMSFGNGYVYFSESESAFKIDCKHTIKPLGLYHIEVIGNTYENRELLQDSFPISNGGKQEP